MLVLRPNLTLGPTKRKITPFPRSEPPVGVPLQAKGDSAYVKTGGTDGTPIHLTAACNRLSLGRRRTRSLCDRHRPDGAEPNRGEQGRCRGGADRRAAS